MWYGLGAIVALWVLLVGVARAISKGHRPLVPGLVTSISGPKRVGKTLYLVHEMLRSVGQWQQCDVCTFGRRREGGRGVVRHRVTVATNISFVPPKHGECVVQVESLADCRDLPHCTLVVLDELQDLAPADPLFRLGEEDRAYLAKCGHYGHELLWSAQSEDRVCVGVRRLTDRIGLVSVGWLGWRVVSFAFFEHADKLRRYLLARATGGKRVGQETRPLWRYTYRPNRALTRAYNTHQWAAARGASGVE